MICIILVAGHGTLLEKEIRSDESGKYGHLEGVPKALLPGVAGKKILDYWWDLMKKNRAFFSQVYLVTNADKYKHFERWATASDFPVENLVNDGTTSYDQRLGAVADLELAITSKGIINEDVLIVAGDMIFQDQKFDLAQVIQYFKSKEGSGDLAIYYELDATEAASTRGIVEICPFTNKVLRFFEKPPSSSRETKSRNASVVFYCLRKSTIPSIYKYLEHKDEVDDRTLGKYMAWLINDLGQQVYGMKLPTGFQLIGHQTTLSDYEEWIEIFSQKIASEFRPKKIIRRAYARVGIVGNPSDGFFGKTISMSIKNFWAEVTIYESSKLRLIPHPLFDTTEFGSLADLHGIMSKEGYLGGLRLLQATCKQFYRYCSEQGIALAKRNFTLSYDTNIPRQVGLAGSSAIVTATLKVLMDFFNLNESDLPKDLQPQFVLEVEVSELRINAGLQDRVVQVYEGMVYMNFDREIMAKFGHGSYEPLDVSVEDLPTFFVVYDDHPSDSGKIHSDVRKRWDSGDPEVIEAMKKFAEFTEAAKIAIGRSNWPDLANLMRENFELRKSIYGVETLGRNNLEMIEIGRKFGAVCKFPGSGGAILGLLTEFSKLNDVRNAYLNAGYVFTTVIPNI